MTKNRSMNTKQRQLLSSAKARLINEIGINEEQAHKFIIHASMTSGKSKLVIAQEILDMDNLV